MMIFSEQMAQISNEMGPTCNLIILIPNNALMWNALDKIEINK